MFLFLSKFIPQFIYPLGLITILLLFALFLNNKTRLQKRILSLALVILWLSGSDFVANSLARSLEWRYLLPNDFSTAEAIVLLGGGIYPPNYPRKIPDLNQSGERILFAAWLYKEKKAPIVVVSGGNLPWVDLQTTEADGMKQLLEIMGVPENNIWVESNSTNTYENAINSKNLLQKHGINKILLVTSGIHMPRSVMTFEKQGFIVVPAPTDFNATQASSSTIQNKIVKALTQIFPSPDNIDVTTRVLKEYLGIIVYRLRGWA